MRTRSVTCVKRSPDLEFNTERWREKQAHDESENREVALQKRQEAEIGTRAEEHIEGFIKLVRLSIGI